MKRQNSSPRIIKNGLVNPKGLSSKDQLNASKGINSWATRPTNKGCSSIRASNEPISRKLSSKMITRNLRNYQAIFVLITVAFCGSSALHILNAIEIKSLWADELKTFYKTVSLSTPQMLNYLRSDSHPPLYYLALQSWFSFFEPNTATLRLASWICLLYTSDAADD